MEKVIIAVGSNLGNRLKHIRSAGKFLENLSEGDIQKSSIWESEPVGGAKYPFLNCVASIQSRSEPKEILHKLKSFEQREGRDRNPVRWGPRIIDLDIISYGELVIQAEGLIIPHSEYKNRTFVLYPLREIEPGWKDPQDQDPIDTLLAQAPENDIRKTELSW